MIDTANVGSGYVHWFNVRYSLVLGDLHLGDFVIELAV